MGWLYRKSGVKYASSPVVARWKHSGGYTMLGFADGTRMLEHRYVMEQEKGRPLESNEHVHHENHKNKADNAVNQLRVMSPSKHATLHAVKVVYVQLTCSVCGADVKRRQKRHQYNKARGSAVTCDKTCAGRIGKAAISLQAHGTIGAYMRCGPPRCSVCKAAMAAYQRERRCKKRNRE